MISLGLWN